MQASRILPDLQCSFLCEDVRQEVSGKFTAVGVLGAILVPRLPISAGRLCVFNRWVAGVGQFLESTQLIAPDQATVMRKTETKFTLKDPVHHATNVAVFAEVNFEAAGVYHVEVIVDEVMKIRYPVPMVLVKRREKSSSPPDASNPTTPPETTGEAQKEE